eukprot:214619-Hanusia_phi.AAC.1
MEGRGGARGCKAGRMMSERRGGRGEQEAGDAGPSKQQCQQSGALHGATTPRQPPPLPSTSVPFQHTTRLRKWSNIGRGIRGYLRVSGPPLLAQLPPTLPVKT